MRETGRTTADCRCPGRRRSRADRQVPPRPGEQFERARGGHPGHLPDRLAAARGQRGVPGPHSRTVLSSSGRQRAARRARAGPASGGPRPRGGPVRTAPPGSPRPARAGLAQHGEHRSAPSPLTSTPGASRRSSAAAARRSSSTWEAAPWSSSGRRTRWPRPAAARAAGHVVDQVVEGLRHRRARGPGEEVVQVGGGPARVQCAAGRWSRRPGRPSRRRRTRRRRPRRGCRPARRPSGPGATSERSGWASTWSTGSGSSPRMPSAAPASPAASRPRPAVESTPPTTHAQPGGLGEHAGTGASRSARRGVRQRSRATRSSAASPEPGGNSASTVEAERRIAGAVCRTRSGDSGFTALPATSRCPTSDGSRTPASQPAARAAQRSGRSCSRQLS